MRCSHYWELRYNLFLAEVGWCRSGQTHFSRLPGGLDQQRTGEGGGCGEERKMWKQDGFEEQFNHDGVPHQQREVHSVGMMT